MDKIVWPNYAAAHAHLFVGGNVEGRLDDGVLARVGIKAQQAEGGHLDVDMETTLEWAVQTILASLEELVPGKE